MNEMSLKPNDFGTDQEVRWCPGCGDYAILKAMKTVLADIGRSPDEIVFVAGIGCAARFPYYMNTYGVHGIHGRAPAIATGLAMARPELDVWVVGGDGDMLSIGGNHLIHALRRNVNLTILLFNNQIYGLTKGQFSPTSERGKVTRSTPMGSIDNPFNAVSVALGAEATFVARTHDLDRKHMQAMFRRAHEHKGAAIVEVYQNCNVFNDGAWEYAKDRETKAETTLELEHGKPLIFGKDRKKGIRLNGMEPEVVELGKGINEDDLLFHDERSPEPSLAYLLSRMRYEDGFPEPIGVFRSVDKPRYDDMINQQVIQATKDRGKGDLEELFNSGETWKVA